MIKKIGFSILFLLSFYTYSQGNKKINSYKYVIIPAKFDFVKKTDQYQTSSLTKFLFKKEGFRVYTTQDKLPVDISRNRCLALIANVVDESSLFTTKMKIELRDCSNAIVFASLQGKSKEKEFKKAYQEGIRNAFKSIKGLKYKYQPLETEIKKDIEIIVPVKEETITSKEEQLPNGSLLKTSVTVSSSSPEILYAQPKKNGFQLVDLSPKVVFQLLKTSTKNFFILKDKNGVLYKSGENWLAEYYENDRMVQKTFQIKF
jgi:hypothetical protein